MSSSATATRRSCWCWSRSWCCSRFWFLMLSPKRAEVSKLGDQVATAQQAARHGRRQRGQLEGSRTHLRQGLRDRRPPGQGRAQRRWTCPACWCSWSRGQGHRHRLRQHQGGRAHHGRSRAAAPAAGPSGSSQPPVAAGGREGADGRRPGDREGQQRSAQSDQANQAATQQPRAEPPGAAPSSGAAGSTSGTAGARRRRGPGQRPARLHLHGQLLRPGRLLPPDEAVRAGGQRRHQGPGRLMTIDNLDFKTTSFPTISADREGHRLPDAQEPRAPPPAPRPTARPPRRRPPASPPGSGARVAAAPAPAASTSPAAGAQ